MNEDDVLKKMNNDLEAAGVPYIEKNGKKAFLIDEQNPQGVSIYRKYMDEIIAMRHSI